MSIGQTFCGEHKILTDKDTGASLIRLTSGRYNSNHLYFTNNAIYDGGKRMVICSDRNERQNFYSIDLETYEFTQLTDFPPLEFPSSYSLFQGIVDGVRNKLYYFLKNDLHCLDLMSLSDNVIYRKPDGFSHHIISTCDNSDCVYTSIYRSFEKGFDSFGEKAPHPESYIVKISIDGSRSDNIFGDCNWLAHVNVSPTDSTKLTFCHEGRWRAVDHRIWGMDVNTGKTWKICDFENASIGHEFWYADGKRIGYHGYAFGKKIIGRINFDNSENVYSSFDYNTGHTFALDENLIVGDGLEAGKYIRLWKKCGEEYSEPLALCLHGSTFKTQSAHVHPRFVCGGKKVVFTSDKGGYEQVYVVDVPENLEKLPKLSALSEL